jgi:hypothetical protein
MKSEASMHLACPSKEIPQMKMKNKKTPPKNLLNSDLVELLTILMNLKMKKKKDMV